MLGKKVKLLREQKNMTQAQLAQRLGVTQEYISLMERGVKYPGLRLGVQLARVLSTTAERLVARG